MLNFTRRMDLTSNIKIYHCLVQRRALKQLELWLGKADSMAELKVCWYNLTATVFIGFASENSFTGGAKII